MENNQNIIEIEEALLGLILTNNKIDENISNVFVYLDFDYFSNKPNQEMFKMFKYFYVEMIRLKWSAPKGAKNKLMVQLMV